MHGLDYKDKFAARACWTKYKTRMVIPINEHVVYFNFVISFLHLKRTIWLTQKSLNLAVGKKYAKKNHFHKLCRILHEGETNWQLKHRWVIAETMERTQDKSDSFYSDASIFIEMIMVRQRKNTVTLMKKKKHKENMRLRAREWTMNICYIERISWSLDMSLTEWLTHYWLFQRSTHLFASHTLLV